jgi:hypothetical protein
MSAMYLPSGFYKLCKRNSIDGRKIEVVNNMGWVNIVNNVYINNFQFAGNIYKKIYIQLSKKAGSN